MPSSPPVLRKSSKTATPNPQPSCSLLEFKNLLLESEERVISKLNAKIDALIEKVSAVESAINDIKAVQVQQEMDIDKIKDLIVTQQTHIEWLDERSRGCNLMVSGLPESNITYNQETLEDDKEKALTLINDILYPGQVLDSDDIVDVTRLGRPGRNPRPLKVKVIDEKCRNNVVRSGRLLNSDKIRSVFGRVYINKDLSYLRRQEEKRLRQKRNELKAAHPDADVRLKNGKLYLGPAVRDMLDYRNQLF